MKSKILNLRNFDIDSENEIKNGIEKVTKTIITKYERQMIVKVMAREIKLGAWYKCPNGHIYAIGDCGGATQSRKCPDCNATIGGANHKLTYGNSVATEMDGATRSAWPGN